MGVMNSTHIIYIRIGDEDIEGFKNAKDGQNPAVFPHLETQKNATSYDERGSISILVPQFS